MSYKERTNLSPELLEKARVELNEIQSQVPGQIQSLREKILEDPDKNFRTDDAFLLRFLRARKFDQDRALELMVKYYRQRDYYPALYNKTKAEVEDILSTNFSSALETRNDEGQAVIFFECRHWDASLVNLEDTTRFFLMTLEALVEDPAVEINGIHFVFDQIGLTMNHVLHFTPWKVRECMSVMMSTFPVRCKGIHVVNEKTIFDAAFLVIRPFLSKKFQERFLFHGDCLPSLHEHINPECLPEELGGDLGPVDHREWNRMLLDRYDEFVRDAFAYGLVNKEKPVKEEDNDEETVPESTRV